MSKALSALNGALPDERPILSLQVIESLAKCPVGYVPVSRTYDEDTDAGLVKQNGLFGKKHSHYICLSKSEGVPGYVLDGLLVLGDRVAAPGGFGVAWRGGRRRLCTRLARTRAAPTTAALTDVIVCSAMRQAPPGFVLAGEINCKLVCYKTSCDSGETSPVRTPDYENVTPDANRRLRKAPERPPKLFPLVSELNKLNLKQNNIPIYPSVEVHEYEALSPAYNLRTPPPAVSGHAPVQTPVVRKAPPPPSASATLGSYTSMDGVPLVLNPKLRGLPSDTMTQLPVITKRTRFELDRDYCYNFAIERQT